MYIRAGSDFVKGCPGKSACACMQQFMRVPGTDPSDVILSAMSGKKEASKLAKKLEGYDYESSKERTNWTMNYWAHSVGETSLRKMPIGRGFSLDAGKIVYSRDGDNHLIKQQNRLNMNTSLSSLQSSNRRKFVNSFFPKE
jgi:hypothetical protein